MRRLASAGVAAVLAPAVAAVAVAAPPGPQTLQATDTGLCPFRLEVTVTQAVSRAAAGGLRRIGPITVKLRNGETGRTATLHATGTSLLDPATGSLTFSGSRLWLAANRVPFLATSGTGAMKAPALRLVGGGPARVLDPCRLVTGAPPSTMPVETPAPWPLPAFALTRIAHAGLTPVVGSLVRHDHVHLDVFVNGREVTIPAGVGHAEPVDRGPGPCPVPRPSSSGDCAPGHFFTAEVAVSPLHSHTTSGIVHIETDRPRSFALGQFFDEWGVRFDADCLGAYCAGRGNELRVYVDGDRVTGDPRGIVLRDGEEIAVVFGGPAAFRSVPARYAGRMPQGCGGAGEHRCRP